MTIRYRTALRHARIALPPISWPWWQAARRLPIPWQPRLELPEAEAAELARERRRL